MDYNRSYVVTVKNSISSLSQQIKFVQGDFGHSKIIFKLIDKNGEPYLPEDVNYRFMVQLPIKNKDLPDMEPPYEEEEEGGNGEWEGEVEPPVKPEFPDKPTDPEIPPLPEIPDNPDPEIPQVPEEGNKRAMVIEGEGTTEGTTDGGTEGGGEGELPPEGGEEEEKPTLPPDEYALIQQSKGIEVDYDNMEIHVTICDDGLKYHGRCKAQLQIYDADNIKKLSSFSVPFEIEKALFNEDTVVATNRFSILNEMIVKIEKVLESVEDLESLDLEELANKYKYIEELLEKLDDVDSLINYVDLDGSTVKVGGVEQGFKTDENGIAINELLYNILHEYVPPVVTLSSNYNKTVVENGTVIPEIEFTITTKKVSNGIVSIVLKRGNDVIYENNKPTPSGETIKVKDTDITGTTTYTLIVNDGNTNTNRSFSITYVAPYYCGVMPKDMVSPIEDDLKDTDKIVKTKSNTVKSYTCADEKFYIAYPSSYGNLGSILDANGFEVLNTFDKLTMTVKGIAYNMYLLKMATTQKAFNVTYKH